MSTRKKLLILDYYGQAIILIACIVGFTWQCLISANDGMTFLITSYVLIGTWQLISVFAHFALVKSWSMSRRIYVGLLAVLALGLLIQSKVLAMYTLVFLVFCSPILALWYFFITKQTLNKAANYLE